MSMKRDHDLHDRRRGRNMAVLLALLTFAALMFSVTIVKLTEHNATVGNPSAGQGGAWIDGFIDWARE